MMRIDIRGIVACAGIGAAALLAGCGNMPQGIPNIPGMPGIPGLPSGGSRTPDVGQLVDAAKSAQDMVREIGEPEEIEIGHGLAENLLGAAPLLKNDRVQHYVNQVGRWLALQTERPDLPWDFGVLDSEGINAFATPGGTVFITKGLLNGLSSEAELAGVLGHEIAHVLRKHHLQALKSNAALNLGGMVGQAYLGKKGGAVGQALAPSLTNATKDLFGKGLDRGDEYEADRIGVIIAARGGYDPYGLITVLQLLQYARPDDPTVALLFKTHPNPGDRLAQLENLTPVLDAYQRGDQGRERFAAAMGRKVEPAPAAKPPVKPAAKPPARPAAKPAPGGNG